MAPANHKAEGGRVVDTRRRAFRGCLDKGDGHDGGADLLNENRLRLIINPCPLGFLQNEHEQWGGRPRGHRRRPRDALEGEGPQRRPQRRLGRRLEEVAKAVRGGYCRLQLSVTKLEPAVRETVAVHRLRALEGGGGVGTRPRYSVVCLWRRPLASRHCAF